MNVSDIREMSANQSLFWIVAACVTAGVASASLFVAFNGGLIMERFVLWKERRRHLRRHQRQKVSTPEPAKTSEQGFRVLNVDQERDYSW